MYLKYLIFLRRNNDRELHSFTERKCRQCLLFLPDGLDAYRVDRFLVGEDSQHDRLQQIVLERYDTCSFQFICGHNFGILWVFALAVNFYLSTDLVYVNPDLFDQRVRVFVLVQLQLIWPRNGLNEPIISQEAQSVLNQIFQGYETEWSLFRFTDMDNYFSLLTLICIDRRLIHNGELIGNLSANIFDTFRIDPHCIGTR